MIKRMFAALALLAAMAAPASAQSFADRTGTDAAIFLRIPFGSPAIGKQASDIRFGFALSSGCHSSLALSGSAAEACSNTPLRSMEFGTGSNANWTLAFSNAGRRTDIASYSPGTGLLQLAGENTGNANWLWIGIAAAGGVALAAKMIDDGDFVACSGDGVTVGNDGRSCN